MSTQHEAGSTYSCPYCWADLEAPAGRWDGWVRCPSCSQAIPSAGARQAAARRARECCHGPQWWHWARRQRCGGRRLDRAYRGFHQPDGSHERRASGVNHRVCALPVPVVDLFSRLPARQAGDFRGAFDRLLSSLAPDAPEAIAAGRVELKTPCTGQSEMIQSHLVFIDRASSAHRHTLPGRRDSVVFEE